MKASRRAALLLSAVFLVIGSAEGARQSKISATKHNLSSSNSTGSTHSTSESQICVFCHTPHGADASIAGPLWNKTLQNTTYTPYTSASLDAGTIQGASAGQPLGSSKLCLSCHDGVLALGSVRVLRGQVNSNVGSGGNTAGSGSLVIGGGTDVVMPAGSGAGTGFTRRLEADLTNDHPISVTFDATLSDRDGELRKPTMTTSGSKTVNRWGTTFGVVNQHDSYRPLLPLQPTGTNSAGQVQCTTCHDPHIRETDLTAERNIKFLRANRFQKQQPTSTYSAENDIICLACHEKGMQGNGNSWAYSVHANASVATQTYKTAAADTREFPSTTAGATANIQVWQAACLNCHDTHTVQGARRLLREGVDTTAVGGIKPGSTDSHAALEETCYQCHRDATGAILNSVTSVPNIRGDYTLANGYHMPITAADQKAGQEAHEIGGNFNDGYGGVGTTGSDCSGVQNHCGADLVESRTKLGNLTPTNRHAECTDCHNPHRVVKNRLFFGNGSGGTITSPETEGTHRHTDTNMSPIHTNVASGVLRGSWGVEPSYNSNSFHSGASNYTVRRGDPGADSVPNDSNADTKGYVTREYQICLKCHSTYAYSTPPNLNTGTAPAQGLTPAGTIATPGVGNALTQYTDQAKEFQAPSTHADNSYYSGSATVNPINLGWDGGANGGSTTNSPSTTDFNTNNHRAWHPVMRATGRTLTKRGMGTTNTAWRPPWNSGSGAAVGTQTMYCTDCHGSNVTSSTSVIPDNTDPATGAGNPWGPHGSANPFILKGAWNKDVTGATAFCMKCHNPISGATGFYDISDRNRGNLHSYHNDKLGGLQCTWCHVAVPHGWKNKMFLVNLNDVGEEAGQGVGSSKEVAIAGSSNYYTQPPYYLEAKLKLKKFSPSRGWDWANCGSAGKTGANLIANSQGSTSNSVVSGADYMNSGSTQPCKSPP